MDVHRFGFLWKGDFGRLVLAGIAFALIIGGILYWKGLHPASVPKPGHAAAIDAEASQSKVTTFDSDMPVFHVAPAPVPLTPPPAKATPKSDISLMAFADSDEPRIGDAYAAYGRFLRCKLLITVDSNRIQTPIVGILMEDVYSTNHQLLIPAMAEVHGMAQADGAESRIGSKA